MANDILSKEFGRVSLHYFSKGFNFDPFSEVIDYDNHVDGAPLSFQKGSMMSTPYLAKGQRLDTTVNSWEGCL